MKRFRWFKKLPASIDDPALRSWLREPGSLTARLQRACRDFRVQVVRGGRLARPVDAQAGRGMLHVREVLLICDGVPVIFAHTRMSTVPRGRLSRWLSRLGSRSLGSLLFAYPGFKRGPIEYCRLDQRHPLYRRAATYGVVGSTLWARRSRHRLGAQEVLVTEVFLPVIGQVI
jgi:chorismate lyase